MKSFLLAIEFAVLLSMITISLEVNNENSFTAHLVTVQNNRKKSSAIVYSYNNKYRARRVEGQTITMDAAKEYYICWMEDGEVNYVEFKNSATEWKLVVEEDGILFQNELLKFGSDDLSVEKIGFLDFCGRHKLKQNDLKEAFQRRSG